MLTNQTTVTAVRSGRTVHRSDVLNLFMRGKELLNQMIEQEREIYFHRRQLEPGYVMTLGPDESASIVLPAIRGKLNERLALQEKNRKALADLIADIDAAYAPAQEAG